MLWNYSAGALIVGQKARKNPQAAKLLLTVAIAGNLLLLGVFKYAGFVLQTVGQFDLGAIPTVNLALPLGISFYTITQIAFLVDTYRSRSTIYPPADYALFVTFFPHLIAGPIYHHAEMIP